MASTKTTTASAAALINNNSNWVLATSPDGQPTYWVPSFIESQRALSSYFNHNDTKPSRHTACLAAVFSTAVFKTVIDLRAFARTQPAIARRGVVHECPTNGARVENLCVEVLVDGEASRSFEAVVEVEQVLARCPRLRCLTVEVFSEDKVDGEAVRRQMIGVKNNGASLLSELAKRSGVMVSIEPGKYLVDC